MVLAAGTGLGTALLMPEVRTAPQQPRASPQHTVLPLEGGHTNVIASTLETPEGKSEREMLTHLSKSLYPYHCPREVGSSLILISKDIMATTPLSTRTLSRVEASLTLTTSSRQS